MEKTRASLEALSLPKDDIGPLPESDAHFDDGARFRIEIPSVEGPDAFQTVMEAAAGHDVQVHRISQGSGIMLQTDAEIGRMVTLGAEHNVEVCLFVGPRAAWDIGVQVRAETGRVVAGALRGARQLAYGVADVVRGCELGLRSVLVADLGQLWVLGRMKESGDLPADLVLKTSVALPAANPATARVLEELGATTINLPVDLSLEQISSIRQAVSVPLDIYIEGADDFGAPVRYYDIPEIVRLAAPVHLKFTVRNAPGIYPSGGHLRQVVLATAQERVRRAAIGLELLRRHAPHLTERHDIAGQGARSNTT